MPADGGPCMHGTRSPSTAAARSPMVAPMSMACRRWKTKKKSRGNEPYTSAIMPLHKNLGGEAGKVVLTIGVVSAGEDDGVDGETPLLRKKVLQNRLPSCTRGPGTLGTTWPATRSMEEGAHRRSAEVSGGIRHRDRRSGARAAKPSAKAPWSLGEAQSGRNQRAGGYNSS
jgi:hypothetical protein